MRTIKFFSLKGTTTLSQYAETQTPRGSDEVCGGIPARLLVGKSAGTPCRAEHPSRFLKQEWGDFRSILRKWSLLVRDGFSRRGTRSAFLCDTSSARGHLRLDNAVFQQQPQPQPQMLQNVAGFLWNHRLTLGACGAVCLLFLSSCAHCPMCGHCGAGASGGKSPANKERTAQARRSASEVGSMQQHFETPMHRSPR